MLPILKTEEKFMENVKSMELAEALFQKNCIKVEKAFFGLKTKVSYVPTNSPVVGLYLEYDSDVGKQIKQLVSAEWKNLKNEKAPDDCSNGHYRLAICFSKDRQFVALQLSQYVDFEYHPISEIRFAEGSTAETVLRVFMK